LALVVEDPDAPMGTFDHWLVWNIPAHVSKFLEGESAGVAGRNHFNELRYRGPCPPKGKPHRYFFKLYALDALLSLPEGSSKRDLESAMHDHIVDSCELVGLYSR